MFGVTFAQTDIPYEPILEANIEDEQLDIPSWAWEGTERELMFHPYTASSGRSHSLETLKRLHSPKIDPTNHAPIVGEFYENWNLRKAIEDWMFAQTGFTLGELLQFKVEKLNNLAKEAEEKKDFTRVEEYYLEAIKLIPGLTPHFFEYVHLLDKMNRYEDLLATTEKFKSDWRVILPRVRAEYQLALRNSNSAEKYELLTKAAADANDFFEYANEHPESLTDEIFANYFFQTLLLYASILLKIDKPKKALRMANEGLKLANTELKKAEALALRAWVYTRRGLFEKAIDDYNEALSLDKLSTQEAAKAYARRGMVLLKLRKSSEALEDFNRAVDLDPYGYVPLYNRALVLYIYGRYPEALEDLDRISSPEGMKSVKGDTERERFLTNLRERTTRQITNYSEPSESELLIDIIGFSCLTRK